MMNPMQRPRGILFDKDGTLTDLQSAWAPAYWKCAQEYVHRYAKEIDATTLLIKSECGWNGEEQNLVANGLLAAGTVPEVVDAWNRAILSAQAFERRSSALNFSDPILDTQIALVESILDTALAEIPAIEGTQELLKELSERGFLLGLATMDSEARMLSDLSRWGVSDLFSFKVGFDSGVGEKPSPGMVNAFAESSQLDPGSIWVIGDSMHDFEMAKRAGAHAIGVGSGVLRRDELPRDLAYRLNTIIELGPTLSDMT